MNTSSSTKSLDREGKEIHTVGFKTNGFDSEVSIDVLRSIYLGTRHSKAENSGKLNGQIAKMALDL